MSHQSTWKSGPRCSTASGFTLMELMVVAGILVIAITGLLTAFISAASLNTANNNKSVAAADAQYVLEQLKNVTYANLATYTDMNFTNLANETVYVTVTPHTETKDVSVNVTWFERQATRNFVVNTTVSW